MNAKFELSDARSSFRAAGGGQRSAHGSWNKLATWDDDSVREQERNCISFNFLVCGRVTEVEFSSDGTAQICYESSRKNKSSCISIIYIPLLLEAHPFCTLSRRRGSDRWQLIYSLRRVEREQIHKLDLGSTENVQCSAYQHVVSVVETERDASDVRAVSQIDLSTRQSIDQCQIANTFRSSCVRCRDLGPLTEFCVRNDQSLLSSLEQEPYSKLAARRFLDKVLRRRPHAPGIHYKALT